MRYLTYLEEPPLDAFALNHCPRDGLGTVLVCVWVVVTGDSGETYNAMRALSIPEKNQTLNFGIYRGKDALDEPGPLVFPFHEFPALEQYRMRQSEDAVVYEGTSFGLELRPTSYRWTEAGGRVELRAERLGKACTFWVPEQHGFEHPVLSRSHLGKVTGMIDGDPVKGIFMLDHIYSRPELTFRETQFTTKLHNYWMNWLVEYEDGEFEGGFAWRGQPGTGFAAAHHYVGGQSLARSDARLEVERTERGSMESVTLALGSDFRATFTQHGSMDWPIHTYGTATTTSRAKRVVNSWNYSENFPLNWGLVEDFQSASAALYGRYPSLRKILEPARVVDGAIRFDARTAEVLG